MRSFYHLFLAWLGAVRYSFPSRKLFVIGVTGTKGKSTTIELINAILEAAGKKTALVSTVRYKIAGESHRNTTGMSMPGRFFLQKFLRQAAHAGSKYAILEVTSQGLAQNRHRFIDFDTAVWTNLHPEHIESHGSFAAYRAIKVNFFRYVAEHSRKKNKTFFINEHDLSKRHFFDAVIGRRAGLPAGKQTYFVSREEFIRKELNGGKESIGDWLAADFNLENAAFATMVGYSLGISWPIIQKALAAFTGIPGRMEYVCRTPYAVVVDYAHTPESLEGFYKAIRTDMGAHGNARGKIIAVLGSAGGGRDKWKRPVLGKIAGRYAGAVILTSEDPYDDDPVKIAAEIEDGVKEACRENKGCAVMTILDRRKAIFTAVKMASAGDTIALTGMGSEATLSLAHGKKIPWDERKIAEEAIRMRLQTKGLGR